MSAGFARSAGFLHAGFLLAGLLPATGCPTIEDTEDTSDPLIIADQPLAGVVDGDPWAFVSGHTDAFLSDEEDYYTLLWSEAIEPCTSPAFHLPYVLLPIPTAVGAYPFDFAQNLTFVTEPGENQVAFEGGIRVEAIEVDEFGTVRITAALTARHDADNDIEGTFEVVVCEAER